jgi:hypothetical protein
MILSQEVYWNVNSSDSNPTAEVDFLGSVFGVGDIELSQSAIGIDTAIDPALVLA